MIRGNHFHSPGFLPAAALTAVAVLLTSAMLLPQAQADENYYRWIDEQGETKISDRPPAPGIDYEIVSAKSSVSQSVSGDGSDDEEELVAETSAAASQLDPEMCQRARDNLDALTSSDRVTMRNEKGELKMLSKEQVAQQIETTEGHISAFCGEE